MEPIKQLEAICRTRMEVLGITGEKAEARLAQELKEIGHKKDAAYFLDQHASKVRYAKNDWNLMVSFLLKLCKDYNPDKQPDYTTPEWPDIDVDYLPEVRGPLKEVFAPKAFGEEKVCNIGSYNTYGLKSALIDMARVFGEDRQEILRITTQLGLKDDEGQILSWEKALEIYPPLKAWVDNHWTARDDEGNEIPGPAQAAKSLIYSDIDWTEFDYKGEPPHRNRSMGMHAGGLIISSVPIHELVPLVRGKDGQRASAWVEGLSGQDLSLVGLVKYDFLVIDALKKIANCVRLIRERHGIDKLYALDGGPHFSDVDAWINDAKTIEVANRGDLKMVFQFDSDGIRELAKKGGVTSFDDIVAYTSLYRPGPMDVDMHTEYCMRKKYALNQEGGKEYKLTGLEEELIGKTYGVLVFQEQVMTYLNRVGKIPIEECQPIIKAISKKNKAKIQKFQEMFVKNAQFTLGITEEEASFKWEQIESFAGYGFNASILTRTSITSVDENDNITQKEIQNFVPGDRVLSVDDLGNTVVSEVVQLHDHGEIYGYEVMFDDGYSVVCSMNHKFLTELGQKSLREILGSNFSILCDNNTKEMSHAEEEGKWMDNSVQDDRTEQAEVLRTRQVLCRVSGEVLHNRRMEGTLRTGAQKQRIAQETPPDMRSVSQVGVEGERERRDRGAQSTLRGHSGNVSIASIAPTRMSTMFGNQEGEYHQEEFSSQSVRRTQNCFVSSSKKNICSPRNSEGTSGEVAFVAGGKPGQIRTVHLSNAQESEALQDGELASGEAEVGNEQDSLRGNSEASGFCEGKYLDRSGRVLPLFRKSSFERKKETAFFTRSSETRCDAQLRGEEARRCDVASSGHGVFCEFDGGDEARGMGLGAEYARIADTGRLVCRRVVRVVPVGKRQMYDLEVAINTHNFLLPNGIVTSNSHATAYSYLSWMMLVLKVHYPIEFYASVMSALPTADDRLKEYKKDAERHGIVIEQVEINLSKRDFAIVGKNYPLAGPDDKIYWGLNKIKGIGEESADAIVAGQPYRDFSDFMERFGTHGVVLKPLISLQVFKEQTALNLFKFYTQFKDKEKKKLDRTKRFEKTKAKLIEEFKLLIDRDPNEMGWDGALYRAHDGDKVDEYKALKKKYDRCLDNYAKKPDLSFQLKDYDPQKEEDIAAEYMESLTDHEQAEFMYYGFLWRHPLEKLKTYTGSTFAKYRDEIARGIVCCEAEVLIKEVRANTSKKGTIYYQLDAEDGTGELARVNVWEDEYKQFSEELVEGNMVRIRLNPPSGGFKTYTFESYPKWKKQAVPAKQFDFRCVVLKKGKHAAKELIARAFDDKQAPKPTAAAPVLGTDRLVNL